MNNINVVIVRSNPINPDPRTENEATSLGKNGYNVSMLGWDRNLQYCSYENKINYDIHRIQLRAKTGIGVIIYWPIWWLIEAIWLYRHEWDIVHAADFDCYVPALIISKIKHKKVIYDLIDHYPDMISLPGLLHKMFSIFNRMIMNCADSIILIDKCKINQIGNIKKEVTIIYNSPPMITMSVNDNSNEKNMFKIFFGGMIVHGRDIKSMINVARDIPDINLEIAGKGSPELVEEIKSLCKSQPNAEYIGPLSYRELLEHTAKSNLTFILYDPNIRNNLFASPAKLFDAMMCKIPVIINEEIAPASIVIEQKCGLLVPYDDYNELKIAVLKLKNDPGLCEKLGNNGSNAYKSEYSWDIMEKRLLHLYQNLV